jgi:hypothetical protein
MVHTKITHSYFKDKVTILNSKLAKGLITKSQYGQYWTMMHRWVIITRKVYKKKVKVIKKLIKTGQITKKVAMIKIKKLKKVVKAEVKISKTQAIGVRKVLKSKLKVGKITKVQFKIAIKKV